MQAGQIPKTAKWEFAIGTTSRTAEGMHYLILDIDGRRIPAALHQWLKNRGCRVFITPSRSGWHIYTDYKVTFRGFLLHARFLGTDPLWLRIGSKRGYWFLADYEPAYLPWNVERMMLRYAASTSQRNSAQTGQVFQT